MQQPKPILFTQAGYDAMKKEQEELLVSRPAAVEDLKKAREMGDLSENGYYKGARAKLSSIDHRLRVLTHMIRYGKVMGVAAIDVAQVGSTVVITDEGIEKIYTLVGEYEADPLHGKISHKSPIGALLLNKKVGETISVTTPKGQKSYRIIKISL